MLGRKFTSVGTSSTVKHFRIVGRGGGLPRLHKVSGAPTKRIDLPARRCMLLGKMDNTKARKISHSGKRSHRHQKLNLHWRRIWCISRGHYVRLRLSMKGLKTIKRLGLEEAARRFHLNLNNPKLFAGYANLPQKSVKQPVNMEEEIQQTVRVESLIGYISTGFLGHMVSSHAIPAVARGARRPLLKLKQTYYHRLWQALTTRRWSEFERLMREMKSRNLNHDEVTYTLKAHHCILNPHIPSLTCYMVLEEMKKSLVHPAVIRMNEHLINSYFELEELKCQPPAPLWHNFVKATWQSSLRLNRQKLQKLKQSLQQMDPEDLMKLNEEDMAALARDEFLQATFSSTLGLDEIHDEPITINLENQSGADSSMDHTGLELHKGVMDSHHRVSESETALDMTISASTTVEEDIENYRDSEDHSNLEDIEGHSNQEDLDDHSDLEDIEIERVYVQRQKSLHKND
ncbi:50S ribosomal protein subunit [Babesia ovis]|uniref:50S ribosomal protein subunit n=1 Tax=Babesia ovis TaxID=5869 RepID=A0A9W5WVI6_BABOV|nr:50S ribosomal protein subunit [Babesia ovis]